MKRKTTRFLASLTAAAAMGSFCCAPLSSAGVKLELPAFSANAAEELTEGDFAYTVSDEKTVTIQKYNGNDSEVTIPAEIDGKTVTVIGEYAFESKENLKTVVIPETVTEIGAYAFEDCKSLTSFKFHEGIKKIGMCAFQKCGLTEVTLPSTLTSSPDAFRSTHIKKATFAENSTIVPDYTFQDCKELEEVILPETVTEIGTFAFDNCKSITSFNFHEGLEKLKGSSFRDTGLTEITLPSTLTSAYGAFDHAESLKKVTFADGTTEVPDGIFDTSPALEEVVLPSTVTSIGNYAFDGCKKLASFNFHEGLTRIGQSAFRETALTEVTLPSTLTSAYCAFNYAESLKKVTFADGAEVVPDSIFDTSPALEEVVLPSTVTSIGNYAFDGCEKLASFTFHEGITRIGQSAFRGTGLIEVTLPSTLTSAYCAFNYAESLKKVTFADGTEKVPDSIFDTSPALEEVVLPSTVTSIGDYAFDDCKKITSFNFHEGITRIGDSAFRETGLIEITLPSTLTSANNAFAYSNVVKATFADGTKTIPDEIFERCYSLSEVILPSTTETISDHAFDSCKNLRSIDIPDSVKTIGRAVFISSGLRSVTIPDNVTDVKDKCFEECKYLKTAEFGKGVDTIYFNTFRDCTSLESVKFASLKEIDTSAFGNCRKLTEIDVEGNDFIIAPSAFKECYSLKDMRFIHLIRPDSDMKCDNEVTAIGTVNTIDVDFSVQADYAADEKYTLKLNVPEGVTVLPDTFKTDTGTVDTDTATSLEIPFSTPNGHLTFSVVTTQPGSFDIDAELEFRHDSIYYCEPIDSVKISADELSISIPSVINTNKIEISGTGPKGKKVDVYLGDKLIASPEANEKNGKYKFEATLPESKDGDKYTFTAKYGDASTEPATALFSKEKPLVKSVMIGVNGKKADKDITDVFTECLSPVMYYIPEKDISFSIKISNSADVDSVYITSTKFDEVCYMKAEYDAENDVWTATGKFKEGNYAPGTLNIIIVTKSKAAELKENETEPYKAPEFFSRPGNVRFLIDPSGIVYEGAPSNPVAGAEMTIYCMDEEGKSVLWDAADYDQQNPLLTDESGAYAWVVPEGEWKVVCNAEGYEQQESEWLSVPPTQTGVNFALTNTSAPEVTDISYDGSEISVKFSRYMLPDTISDTTIVLDAGKDIAIEPVFHASDEEITDTFTISGDFTDVVDVNVEVKAECKSYASAEAVPFTKKLRINEPEPEETTTTTTAATTASTTTTTTTTTATATKATTVPKTTTKSASSTTTTTSSVVTTTDTSTLPTTTSTATTTTASEPYGTMTTKLVSETSSTTTTTTTAEPVTTTTTSATPETPDAPVLGDPNGDGKVDAKDASFVLIEYAKLSTGAKSDLTAGQNKAADVNDDGKVDAKDASMILTYYAYTSTGGTDSFETFKKKQ